MPKILDDKKASDGNRYRLQQRGAKFDVIHQDAHSWRYKVKGADERTARNDFELRTIGAKAAAHIAQHHGTGESNWAKWDAEHGKGK